MSNITGQCLCGEIKVTIPIPTEERTALCHCTDCRRLSGANYSTNFTVPPDQLNIEGTPKIFGHKGSSGKDVRNHFCGTCGAPIFAEAELVKGVVFVRAGLFDPGNIPKPSTHLFSRNMESWELPISGAKVLETE